MPLLEERTSLWWKEGFPGVIEDAPWEQCLETGLYGFILDSEKLTLPHFGPLRETGSLESLPPADLQLKLEVDGKSYRATAGGEWSKYSGPRIVDSGKFFQRFDVTDLIFESEDKTRLNVEARLEVAAWHDRVSFILSARPGVSSLKSGMQAFGKVGGGFGLDGTNQFVIPTEATAGLNAFTLSFYAFVPPDFKAGEHSPSLICKSGNELTDGHLGIILDHLGAPMARINPGGGPGNAASLVPTQRRPLKLDEWNHLVLSYDGTHYHFYVNGQLYAEEIFATARPLISSPITFGRRGDGFGDGYPFRGTIDEIRLYNQVVDPAAIQNGSAGKPTGEWSFDPAGQGLETKPRDQWSSGKGQVTLNQGESTLSLETALSEGSEWTTVALPVNPMKFSEITEAPPVSVEATEFATREPRPVAYETEMGWHRINLDGIAPISPPGDDQPSHDAVERIHLRLVNEGAEETTARLLFEKTARGIRQRIGTPITGISAILRDPDGNPTGLPVQLSKNWHNHPAAGVYSGQWFHGISQIRLPAESETELELTLCYGHWGGVAAASHAQLSLIGWGSNQRWDQSALGAWGESVCYEPDQIQGKATITDVRPLMVTAMSGKDEWSWTSNVGGGDFFRLFDAEGKRMTHAALQANYLRHGPCLTEVTYAGRVAEGIPHSSTVSLARTDDLIRATYRIRLDVTQEFPFSRFAIFQVGADSYNMTHEAKFALGNEEGLTREWKTTPGGNQYQAEPHRAAGEIPWISMHEGAPVGKSKDEGAWANRGIVIRSWKARLGGEEAAPWVAEFGNESPGRSSSTADIVPPPWINSLQPGDFVEATIEHLIIPQSADDYLGPNTELKEALVADANTWRMIEREAKGNERRVQVTKGMLEHRHPDIRIKTVRGKATLKLQGGIGYVPVTFTGLPRADSGTLWMNGIAVDQSVHGNDFWQTDYDAASTTWSRTYNFPANGNAPIELEFR